VGKADELGATMNLSFRRCVQSSRSTRPQSVSSLGLGLLLVVALLMPLTHTNNLQAQDTALDVSEAEGANKPKTQADVVSDLAQSRAKDEADAGAEPRQKEVVEKIYAVQRMSVLRTGRFELTPSFATTFNDPYVSHPSVGVALNYWITNVLAVGVNLLWYEGLSSESELNFSIRRSARLAVPITEYQLGTYLNFTYVPVYGKFELFNDAIVQWDAYLVGGVGMLRTRPIAVIDPAVRSFDYDWHVAMNAGLGLRVFVTKWLSVFGELRDYLYMERLENLQVSLDARSDRSTWLDKDSTLTHNVTVALGFSVFFPFSFDYRYPK